ncbi:protein ROOT PRIMORDIUM DEFECTIVE 1 [Rhododendron vialii]|uniref:protein ROOT PRIMORDIUM DEFECTIVE 1 n=1 Tax=Rhododendron vialii TaxID=182163 RepID=UPI00265E18D4|nr:protein ROOT PRIMORDIUM DEFECTIVE 1 [Rhododendron vialii]
MKILQKFTNTILKLEPSSTGLPFGPFNSTTQRRWKKRPVSTAQTRLESQRTRDSKLDKLTSRLNQLARSLTFHRLISARKRSPFVSLHLISRWKNVVGLNVSTTVFLRKYPHVFEVFTHPLRRIACCRIGRKMRDLIQEEEDSIRELELENVLRIKKLLMMSVNGTIHIHGLRLARRELGLPKDFRESILQKYSNEFRLVDLEIVGMVDRGEVGVAEVCASCWPGQPELSEMGMGEVRVSWPGQPGLSEMGVAEVEKWREREFREKWLSEFETKYAFPISLPTGFKIEAGYRERLRNWQRLPYVKPYERKEVVRVRTCGGAERFEKRAVGILHEFLCLTVEKMVGVERLVHFRKDLGIEVNLREAILKHAGIFYLSTKGSAQTVFLREAYSKGCLIVPNQIYAVRRKMLDLILTGRRNTRELRLQTEVNDESRSVAHNVNEGETRDGDWVISLLDNFKDQSNADKLSEI